MIPAIPDSMAGRSPVATLMVGSTFKLKQFNRSKFIKFAELNDLQMLSASLSQVPVGVEVDPVEVFVPVEVSLDDEAEVLVDE